MLAHPIAFLLIIAACFFFGVGIPILVCWWILNLCTTLTVTDRRTVLRRGLLSKDETQVRHSDVRNVQIYQSFIHRLVGVGAVGISSSGQADIEIRVRDIPNPAEIRRLITV
ncbi:MAG: PH domain-containing protein [Planctomycetaceae bacterium]|nr:PH domain-containing protein [Planctomycetaceae bacterium]